MVLCHVLLSLRDAHGYAYKLVGVHIDYANRPESAAEARRPLCVPCAYLFV